MIRILAFGMAALVLGAMAANVSAADVKTSMITFKSGDVEVSGFLAEPEGPGPYPAIVVIQEWWGLTDWIKDNAKRLAGLGYVTLAPDLYHGKVAQTPQAATQLMKGLPRDRAVRDLKAAVSTLTEKANVKKDKIGSVGWCMGGGYSLDLALNDTEIKACVVCYGRPVTDAAKLKPLQATVLGIFGEEDRGIPPSTVQKFESALKEAGKKIAAMKLYPAGHGFMRPGNPGQANPVYNEEAAKDAWKQIEAFFGKQLGGSGA
jgi:carboxymethylenebutenolidase